MKLNARCTLSSSERKFPHASLHRINRVIATAPTDRHTYIRIYIYIHTLQQSLAGPRGSGSASSYIYTHAEIMHARGAYPPIFPSKILKSTRHRSAAGSTVESKNNTEPGHLPHAFSRGDVVVVVADSQPSTRCVCPALACSALARGSAGRSADNRTGNSVTHTRARKYAGASSVSLSYTRSLAYYIYTRAMLDGARPKELRLPEARCEKYIYIRTSCTALPCE